MGVGEHRGYKLPPSYGVHRSRPLPLSILLSSPKLETQRGRQGVFQGSEIFEVDPPGTATNTIMHPIIPVILQCPPRSDPRLGQPRIVQKVQLAWVGSAGTFPKDPQSPSTLGHKLDLQDPGGGSQDWRDVPSLGPCAFRAWPGCFYLF